MGTKFDLNSNKNLNFLIKQPLFYIMGITSLISIFVSVIFISSLIALRDSTAFITVIKIMLVIFYALFITKSTVNSFELFEKINRNQKLKILLKISIVVYKIFWALLTCIWVWFIFKVIYLKHSDIMFEVNYIINFIMSLFYFSMANYLCSSIYRSLYKSKNTKEAKNTAIITIILVVVQSFLIPVCYGALNIICKL